MQQQPQQLRDPLLTVVVTETITVTKTRNLPPRIEGLHEILTGSKSYDLFQLHRVRWFVLFVFGLLCFNHGWLWMTFSPLANVTVGFFGLCPPNATTLQHPALGEEETTTTTLNPYALSLIHI